MFTGINNLIRYCYEQDYSTTIYNGVVVLAFFVQLVFLYFYRKNYGLNKKQAILTVLLVYPVAYVWMLVLCWVENGFSNWGANNIVRLYVWVPLIAIGVGKLLKIKTNTICDYLAPSMALEQAIGHTVCPFAGCCCSYPMEGGLYNPVWDNYLFPNQWLECIVALAIFFCLKAYAKKHSYNAEGYVFPLFLILFGATRFFLEFLRNNKKLFWNISNLAIHAFIMVVVGVIWLLCKKKRLNPTKKSK